MKGDPVEEVAEAEWLYEIIGGARGKRHGMVIGVGSGGHHDHWKSRPALTNRRENTETVPPWQHPVEDDEIGLVRQGAALTFETVEDTLNRVAHGPKATHNEVGDSKVVFDEQDAC